MGLSKPPAGSVRGPAPAVADLDLFDGYPVLRAFLLDRTYEDGSARATSTLTLFLGDQGLLGGTLKDRDCDRAIFGVGLSIDDLAASLERQLASENTPWRADRQTTGSSSRIRGK